jgi:hypothetical protein
MSRFRLLIAGAAAASALLAAGPVPAYLQFGPEEIVQSGGDDILVEGYSVPSFVDFDSDGLKDLVVGEGGSLITGRVRIYANVGTAEAPLFDGFTYAQQAEGEFVYPGG